ncbi:MAG: hypothetical protein RIR39_4 [Pseudomonadota bacterium]|jgi:hypothetical protein
MNNTLITFANLDVVTSHLREILEDKKYVLLFAYNGTGKTRLSMAFKDAGRNGGARDALYFNAFTEDLFTWDNDLDNDAQRVLRINKNSHFFDGLQELEMESRIRPLLQRYADFNFFIDYDEWTVNFVREVKIGDHIKVSRGEENIFIWCFFLAIAQLAIDEQEAYSWVKFLYIDDPISSLDDNNAIAVASHLAQLLKKQDNKLKIVISSHHTLFFNVMCNELKSAVKYFLSKDEAEGAYTLRDTTDTPFFNHVSLIKDLHKAVETGNLYTYHFNILRNILEKTATFHGFKNFSACIKQDNDDPEGIVHARMINILSHGNYSLFEPMEMINENKQYFNKILSDFMSNYRFNPELFPEEITETNQT